MTTTCDPLVFDLVQWVAREPRTYAEVIDAWKTSCPRLTVWEDAIDQGFITRKNIGARGTIVVITGAGRALLEGRTGLNKCGRRTMRQRARTSRRSRSSASIAPAARRPATPARARVRTRW